MRRLALGLTLISMSGGCGFTYGAKLSPEAAPFSYTAWGGDSGVAYGNVVAPSAP